MADLTKLPYFLQHIDETDTVESIRLNAYLQGLQSAYFGSANRQQDLGGNHWFCMRDTMALDPKRHPEFIKEMIWTVLEKLLRMILKTFEEIITQVRLLLRQNLSSNTDSKPNTLAMTQFQRTYN